MSDSALVDLNVVDDDAWRHICALQHEVKSTRPTLTVTCGTCGAALAHAGPVPTGHLWSARWETVEEFGVEVRVSGEAQKPRSAARRAGFDREIAAGQDGYFADLAVPDGSAKAVPLYVRCSRHGDAVLSRDEVLGALRSGRPRLKVRVATPFATYVAQRIDGLDATVSTQRYTATIKGDAMTIPEFEAFWASGQRGAT